MKLLFLFLIFIGFNGFGQSDVNNHNKRHVQDDNFRSSFSVVDKQVKCDQSKTYFWFKAQNVFETMGGSSGQLLHGEFQSFHIGGQLHSKGKFNNGLKDKEWLYWREDGTLLNIERWKNGVLFGKQEYYNDLNEDTLVVKVGFFRTKSISKKGKMKTRKIIETKNRKKVTEYDDNGNKESITRYQNNKVNGKQEQFENGESIKVTRYKNGVLINEDKIKKVELGVKK